MGTQHTDAHTHDYKPTKAGTYWKVCSCGARKHFMDAQREDDLRQFLRTRISGISTAAENDILGTIFKQREQARQELLDELLNELPDEAVDVSDSHSLGYDTAIREARSVINAKRKKGN